MYEEVVGIIICALTVLFILLLNYGRRRNGTSTDIPGTDGNKREAETNLDTARREVAEARDNNNAARADNRQLREECDRAEQLIERGKEILGIKND